MQQRRIGSSNAIRRHEPPQAGRVKLPDLHTERAASDVMTNMASSQAVWIGLRTSYLVPLARLATSTCGRLWDCILSRTDAPSRVSRSRSAVRSSSLPVVMDT